jgi:hypothetical protein
MESFTSTKATAATASGPCPADVTAAGPNRILRIQVDTRKAGWDLMGSIGHGLRHAVEVLGDCRP